ncbi:MAG: thiamine biosynthesis lipoprotein, partial [Marinomonas primoryensis]
MRKKILISAFLFIVIATVYRFSIFSPELASFSGPTMGTTYTVKFYTTENVKRPSDLKVGVDAALVRVNKLMSTYDPNSELSVFNKLPENQFSNISEGMAYVIDKALLISEMSGGEYDITIGPLVNLWGFGPGEREDKVPSQVLIDEAKSRVGYHYLKLDGRKLTKEKNIYVDLSSIAKGYGVDMVAQVLQDRGV